MIKRIIVGVALMTLFAATAWGHAVWLEKRRGDVWMIYGHGPQEDNTEGERIKVLKAFDAQGQEVAVKTSSECGLVKLDYPEGTATLISYYDNGFWSKGPDGQWVNKSKKDVQGAKEAQHSIKTMFAVRGAFAKLPAKVDLPLVILPQADPMKLKMGDTLKVLVLKNGKPFAGAELTNDFVGAVEESVAKTDADGFAVLTVRNDGLNVFGAYAKIDLTGNADADYEKITAVMSFTVQEDDR